MNAPVKIKTVAIDEEMIGKAEALGIDVVRACEAGLYAAIRRAPDPRSAEEKKAADAQWAEENRAAMEASNRWVEEHGLPGAAYRIF
jgi:antitoxin CcdA